MNISRSGATNATAQEKDHSHLLAAPLFFPLRRCAILSVP
jgi:hypothetical protein